MNYLYIHFYNPKGIFIARNYWRGKYYYKYPAYNAICNCFRIGCISIVLEERHYKELVK